MRKLIILAIMAISFQLLQHAHAFEGMKNNQEVAIREQKQKIEKERRAIREKLSKQQKQKLEALEKDIFETRIAMSQARKENNSEKESLLEDKFAKLLYTDWKALLQTATGKKMPTHTFPLLYQFGKKPKAQPGFADIKPPTPQRGALPTLK